MVFCITIMCLGLIGNIMVPIVILKTKDMRNSTNIFLINLSIADLLVLLICTPTVLVEINSKPETWVLGGVMCKLVPFVELLVAHASILTILAISFERYYAICEPLKAGYVCTKTRALSICLLCWIIAGIFTSPILDIASYNSAEEYYDGSKVPVCLTAADTFWTSVFFISSIIIFFILPLLILIGLYTIIAKHLMAANPSIISAHSSRSNFLKYRKQVILMLAAVVVSFFTCMLPFRAFMLLIIVTPVENLEQWLSSQRNVEIYYCLLYICRCMWYLNTAMNPILYNLMSSKFRDGFIKLLKCKPLIRATSWTESTRKGTFHTTSTNLSSSANQNNNIERIKEAKNLEAKSSNIVKCVTITLSESSNIQHDNNNKKRHDDFTTTTESFKILSEVEILSGNDVEVVEEFEEENYQDDDDRVFYDTLLTIDLSAGKESLV